MGKKGKEESGLFKSEEQEEGGQGCKEGVHYGKKTKCGRRSFSAILSVRPLAGMQQVWGVDGTCVLMEGPATCAKVPEHVQSPAVHEENNVPALKVVMPYSPWPRIPPPSPSSVESLTPAEQKYSVGEREALACVWACEQRHMYLYGRHFMLRTDHQALTALLAKTGSGHKPLRLYRRATPCSALETAQDPQEPELILMLHTPLQRAVSLQELEAASAQDPVLTKLRTFIRGGWPTKVPEELQPFYRVKAEAELSCWNDVCVARGVCTVIPSALRARVLTMVHEGHLGVIKQRCRGLV
ncbi:hypothetical protein L3Q82_002032 [Scortum barcoo]|uniref:Uncharacterized protein n=1 Tax=Scortum barcoo TaxID=214431 RepID=A0ACB8W1D1_9TELE|nr:hypothetical protein L3Q82_002032 [Scortum barcoo]